MVEGDWLVLGALNLILLEVCDPEVLASARGDSLRLKLLSNRD